MEKQIYIERHPAQTETPRRVFNTLKELEETLASQGAYFTKILNADLSNLDFNCPKGKKLLSQINGYDDKTTWPNDLKEKMALQLECGKNSGLDISSVHKRGITGKGVNIAIIDKCLLLEHPEYKDNVKYYKEFGTENFIEKVGFLPDAQYHGAAVSSLSVGTNCGSAPDAGLYFLATHDFIYGKLYLDTRLDAIRHLIELNNTLSEKDKIRCLSCSWGSKEDSGFKERIQLFKQLEETGCMVFGGYYECIVRGSYYGGSKSDITSDAPDNLIPEFAISENTLIVPKNQRTFASYTGGYIYEKKGGQSWTFPYMAGLVACALQAYPNYTAQKDWQNKIWKDLSDTALPRKDGNGKIVQPVAFIERMEQYQKEYLSKIKQIQNNKQKA